MIAVPKVAKSAMWQLKSSLVSSTENPACVRQTSCIYIQAVRPSLQLSHNAGVVKSQVQQFSFHKISVFIRMLDRWTTLPASLPLYNSPRSASVLPESDIQLDIIFLSE